MNDHNKQSTLDNSKAKRVQEKFELSRVRIIKKFELSKRKKKKIRIIESFYYIFENMSELT